MFASNKPSLLGWTIWLIAFALLFFSSIGAFVFDNVLAWSAGIIYVTYDTWLLIYVAVKTRKLDAGGNVERLKNESKSVDVLIPVFNENHVLIPTVEHILAQQFQANKIIIINDGSTDETLNIIEDYFGFTVERNFPTTKEYQSKKYRNLYLIHKNNTGKADSLNQAIKFTNADVIITVDADTLLEKNAVTAIKYAFEKNRNLIAACGILRPVSSGNFKARIFSGLQFFEYLRAFLARAAWARTNALLLVSGAFSAYDREAIVKIGGYDTDSLVEDYELIHRIHKYSCENDLSWQVGVVANAYATTDAPGTISAFIQQRKRWFAGFLRTQFQYQEMIGSPAYRSVGKFMMPIKTIDTVQPIFGLLALYFLILFFVSDIKLASYALVVIAIKLSIDFCFHLWALNRYHNWLNRPYSSGRWWQAVLCCLFDPFFFQPLRHFSALVGWSMILNPSNRWVPIRENSIKN